MEARASLLPVVVLPQCEARRESVYANDTPDTNRQCHRSARYKIEGRNFCQRHAEMAALRILMGEHR